MGSTIILNHQASALELKGKSDSLLSYTWISELRETSGGGKLKPSGWPDFFNQITVHFTTYHSTFSILQYLYKGKYQHSSTFITIKNLYLCFPIIRIENHTFTLQPNQRSKDQNPKQMK